MFPNQTPEQPQQPSQPQPIQPPVEPPVPPTTPEPTPVAPETTAPNPFVAATPAQPSVTPTPPTGLPIDTPSDPAPKKPVNKKLIAIIIAIVVLLGLGAVAYFVVLPMFGAKTGGENSINRDSSNNSEAELKTVEGDGYSVLIPAAYIKVPSESTDSVKYSQDGTDLTTVPGVSVFTYKAPLSESLFETYSSPMADTAVSKGYTFEKVSYAGGLSAIRSQATVVKDGKDLYVSRNFAVKTSTNMYLVTVTVPTGDDSGLEAQADKILSSFVIE